MSRAGWALVLALVATPALAQDRADDLSARLARLREETAATEARQRQLGEELVDIAGDAAKLREKREAAAARLQALESRVAAEEAELARLDAQGADLRDALAGKRAQLATLLAALQRLGRRPPPALFGDGGTATDTVRGAILLNAALPGLDASAQALAAELAAAARVAAEERARWAELKTDLAAVEDERKTLDALGAELERRRALSTYERDRAAADLARLGEEADSVAALIAGLSKGATPPPPAAGFAARRGRLPDPVAGAVVTEYGEPTEAGGVSEGRTYAALPEATVFAPMPATVLFSAPFRGYGHVLILDAGEGYHLVLAGLDLASVAPGDRVGQGMPVGRMGRDARRSAVAAAGTRASSLLGTRPALYVELRKDGAAIDSHGWWAVAAGGGRTGG